MPPACVLKCIYSEIIIYCMPYSSSMFYKYDYDVLLISNIPTILFSTHNAGNLMSSFCFDFPYLENST
jgi:hypothetical protein